MAAILALIRKALQDKQTTYLHMISGQDILVKGYTEFDKMFSDTDRIYMTCKKIDETGREVQNRLKYAIPSANWDEGKIGVKLINKSLYLLQKFFHKERTGLGDFSDIYKGMLWISMPINPARYVIAFADENPDFMKALMHTRIPEEFFFQTILMNSRFCKKIIRDNLRYTDWNDRNGSCPAFLDESDFNKIKESGAYFARKIDPEISYELINMIEDSLR